MFVNPRRLSHFASKSVEGCDLRPPGRFGKKSDNRKPGDANSDREIKKTCLPKVMCSMILQISVAVKK